MQCKEYLDYSIYTNKIVSYQNYLTAEKPKSDRMHMTGLAAQIRKYFGIWFIF